MKKIAKLEKYEFFIDARDKQGNMFKQRVVTSDGVLLKTPLNTMVIGGREPCTHKILKDIDRVCDIIDKAQASKEKILLLEDADYKFLREKHDSYTNWSPQDEIRKCILKMGKKLENPEPYDPAKKTDKKTHSKNKEK